MSAPSSAPTSPSKPLPKTPHPARPSSPPPAPRNNALGLPPTYAAHLRALLRQWLAQQVTVSSTSAAAADADVPLWTDDELAKVERALWDGCVSQRDGRRGLLALDWAGMAAGSARRRAAAKAAELSRRASGDVASSRASVVEAGKLAPPSAPSLSASPAAGSVHSTRTPSIASSNRSVNGPEDRGAEDETDRKVQEWCHVISGLKGFEPLPLPKRDEWDIVNDTLPPADPHARDLPGAFPQSSHVDHAEARSPTPVPPTPVTPICPTDLLKPIFCVRFDATPLKADSAAGTVRAHRQGSFGSTLAGSTGSVGSSAGRRWWANSGSSSKLSEMTAVPSIEVEAEFVEGKFALPSKHERTRKETAGKKRRHGQQEREAESTRTSSNGDDDGDESDADSTWSGTQRTASRVRNPATSVVVAGADNDVPPNEDVRLLGGTIVIRGTMRDIERKALEHVLRVLVYTIQAMFIELDLLDAFRMPREFDSAPAPPLPAKDAKDRPRASFDLHRRLSGKDRDRDAKRGRGLFQRFTRESRGVLDGLFGRSIGGRRGSESEHARHHSLSRVDSAPPSSLLAESMVSFPSVRTEKSILPSTDVPSATTVPLATDRHLQVLDKLEKLLPSTTPGLALPMPPILLRVRDEDNTRRDKVRAEAEEVDGLPASGTATPRVVSGHTTALSTTTAAVANDVRGRALGYRLGGDVRTGLGALYSTPESFEGWARLQKLDTLYAVGTIDEPDGEAQAEGTAASTQGHGKITLCQAPKPQSHVYWDTTTDMSIRAYLEQAADDAGDMAACGRAGCDTVSGEHARWWLHAGRRVGMIVERVKSMGEGEHAEPPVVDAWVTCGTCGETSVPRALSDVAAAYSWSKFLELLFYTRTLIPPSLCAHVAQASTFPPVTYHLRTPHVVAALTLSPIAVLDTRLPKLQVGPNVHKRKPGKVAAAAALDATLRRAPRDDVVDGLRAEIECFFVGLEQRVAVLRVKVKEVNKPSSSPSKDESKEGDGSIVGDGNLPPSGTATLIDVSASFRHLELALYDLLGSTPASQINGVRRRLIRAIHDSTAELDKWQKAHDSEETFEGVPLAIPDYATDPKIHCLPGSATLVREDEPSSLIAYTLSSLAYFTELTRAPTDEPTNFDADGVTIEVKRKDTPRDLLSLRTLAKKSSEASVSLSSTASARPPLALTPNAPVAGLVEVTHEQVEGKSQFGQGDRLGDLVRTISKATAQNPILTTHVRAARSPSVSAGSMSESDAAGSGAPSALGSLSALSSIRATPKTRPTHLARRGTGTSMGDSAPPSAFRASRSVSGYATSPPTTPATAGTVGTTGTAGTAGSASGREGWSSVTSTFASSFQSLVKTATDVGESLGSLKMRAPGERSLTSLIGPLSITSSMDTALTSTGALDELPHIHFSYAVADRVRLGCTVYHATAFDSLRRRCAVDKSVIASLARTNVWDAQGGKSKASFFMTTDGRYIVKELVSKWNVSDTHALLEIAPAYFGHLANTHNRATSLAKIVGFYSVRLHDLQTNNKRQLDLLVMENLFYKQEVSHTYDLKGIEGRKVPKVSSGGTLFDGEWLEGQSKSPILLHPHARRILCEAVSIDTRFLSAQSIMDYSLLLGLDDARREMVIGLVDAIGSFNLFKTIESRGKLALNRGGGEVTIIPPDQYRERFENAIRQYFVACPDKWSKNAKTAPTSAATLPKINTREADPNEYITFIRALPGKRDSTDAEHILKAVAAQMKKIMEQRFMLVGTLEEAAFNRVFAGRNWNHGQSIELVLRRPGGQFLPLDYVISVMCHEMAHITHMNHGAEFQKLNAAIKRDVAQLQARGYYGDGFWSDGRRLRDDARMGDESLCQSDFPEYICGVSAADARKAKRPRAGPTSSRGPGLVKGEASNRSGRQTEYRRKAGQRNNVDMGDGARLDGKREITKEDKETRRVWIEQDVRRFVETGLKESTAKRKAAERFDQAFPWYKEGSTKGKTAAELRAAAAEARLTAFASSKLEAMDPDESHEHDDDDGDEQFEVKEEDVEDPHISAEDRRREMEEEMEDDEMDGLRGGWEAYVGAGDQRKAERSGSEHEDKKPRINIDRCPSASVVAPQTAGPVTFYVQVYGFEGPALHGTERGVDLASNISIWTAPEKLSRFTNASDIRKVIKAFKATESGLEESEKQSGQAQSLKRQVMKVAGLKTSDENFTLQQPWSAYVTQQACRILQEKLDVLSRVSGIAFTAVPFTDKMRARHQAEAEERLHVLASREDDDIPVWKIDVTE
ncbi:hypothetical protein Q5752_000449 [Cryptotrichosporon argae]